MSAGLDFAVAQEIASPPQATRYDVGGWLWSPSSTEMQAAQAAVIGDRVEEVRTTGVDDLAAMVGRIGSLSLPNRSFEMLGLARRAIEATEGRHAQAQDLGAWATRLAGELSEHDD